MTEGQQYTWDLMHPYSFMVESMKYWITDEDLSGDPQYFGFTDKTGGWKILQYSPLDGTYRYARGDDSNPYPGNWINRGILTYDYPYKVW